MFKLDQPGAAGDEPGSGGGVGSVVEGDFGGGGTVNEQD
jgi:hypothetical protein